MSFLKQLSSPTVRSAASTSILRVGLAGLLFVIQAVCAAVLPAAVSDQVVAAVSTAVLISSILAFGSPDTVIRLSDRRAEVTHQTMLGIVLFGIPVAAVAAIINPGLTAVAFSGGVFLALARMRESENRGNGRNRAALVLFYGSQIIVFAAFGLLAWLRSSYWWALVPMIFLVVVEGTGLRLFRRPGPFDVAQYKGWFWLGARRVLTIARTTVDVLLVAAVAGAGVATIYALVQRLGLIYQLTTFGFVYDSAAAFRESRDDGTLVGRVADYGRMNRIVVILVTLGVAVVAVGSEALGLVRSEIIVAVVVYAFGQAYQAATGPLSNVLLVLGNDRWLVTIAGIAVLLQAAAILALSGYGIVGVAFASSGALVLARTIMIVASRRALQRFALSGPR